MRDRTMFLVWVVFVGASLFATARGFSGPMERDGTFDIHDRREARNQTEPARCVGISDQKRDEKYQIFVRCVPIDREMDRSFWNDITEVLWGAGKIIQAIPNEAVLWNPENNYYIFNVAKDAANTSLVICRLETHTISEIPGQGKYLRAGWLRPKSDKSARFLVWLAKRGFSDGKVSYHADAYFSFIDEDRLDEARLAGACHSEKQLLEIPESR